MDLGLKNKTVVVTGGTSGIGLATARLLLQEGARVAICGRDQKRLDDAKQELADVGAADHLEADTCDVLRQDEVQDFARRVLDKFGAVDGLVNNAGTARLSTFETTADADWSAEFTLKLFSVIYPIRAFLDALKRSETAAIVNVNSLLALQPEPHLVATSAARAGLLNLTRSMADAFAPDAIRVNSILLGTIDSGQWQRRFEKSGRAGESYQDYLSRLAKEKNIPLGRFGKPEEPARAIAFLVSPAASYTTGAALDISAGMARHI